MLNKTLLQKINRDVTIVRRTGQAKLEISNQRETHMNLFTYLNKRTNMLSYIDMKLIGFGSFLIGIIVAKLFPVFFETLGYHWLIILVVLCLVHPVYIFLFKKDA